MVPRMEMMGFLGPTGATGIPALWAICAIKIPALRSVHWSAAKEQVCGSRCIPSGHQLVRDLTANPVISTCVRWPQLRIQSTWPRCVHLPAEWAWPKTRLPCSSVVSAGLSKWTSITTGWWGVASCVALSSKQGHTWFTSAHPPHHLDSILRCPPKPPPLSLSTHHANYTCRNFPHNQIWRLSRNFRHSPHITCIPSKLSS